VTTATQDMSTPEARAAYYEQCWKLAAEAAAVAERRAAALDEQVTILAKRADERAGEHALVRATLVAALERLLGEYETRIPKDGAVLVQAAAALAQARGEEPWTYNHPAHEFAGVTPAEAPSWTLTPAFERDWEQAIRQNRDWDACTPKARPAMTTERITRYPQVARANALEGALRSAYEALRKVPIVRLNPGKEGTDGFLTCPGCGAEASTPCRPDCYVKAVEDVLSDMEEFNPLDLRAVPATPEGALEERVRALAARLRKDAERDAGDYYGDQFERRPDIADELDALLAAPSEEPPGALCNCSGGATAGAHVPLLGVCPSPASPETPEQREHDRRVAWLREHRPEEYAAAGRDWTDRGSVVALNRLMSEAPPSAPEQRDGGGPTTKERS
jgi:hypothetical protein